MSARVLVLALLQVGAVALIGRAVVAAVAPRLDPDQEWLGPTERWLLSVAGSVAFASALMLGNIASGGRIFDRSWVVRLAAAAVLFGVAWRRRGARPRTTGSRRTVLFALLALVLVVLYALPPVRGGSALRTGDIPWHLGWTEQLLGGDPLPTGPAPDQFARNAYPWGYHAVLATMVRLVPGSDPSTALHAMHFLLLTAIPLAAACLARVVNRRAGLAAAAAAGLIGGFGWISAGAPAFVASPSEARYGADLVVASPNSVYELLPPALPRELGLVLLAAAAVLLAALMRRPSRTVAVAAGVAVGLVGLVSVPMFLSACLWGAVLAVASRRFVAGRTLATTGAVTAAIFGTWALPVLVNYVRFDGFVRVSPRLGVEWDLVDGVASWGLLLPLALGGLVVAIAQPSVVRRPLVVYAGCATFLLVLAWMRGRAGWDVLANETVLHPGRYWPALHLIAAAFAGIGLTVAYGWLRARSKIVAAATTAVVFGLGAISPAYASIALTRTIREAKEGFLYGEPDLQPGSFVRSAAARMDPDEVMRVFGGDPLAFYLWQFSGARITYDGAGEIPPNPWRIRYRDLARDWDAAERDGLFDADWIIAPDRGDAATDPETSGTFRGRRWEQFPTAE